MCSSDLNKEIDYFPFDINSKDIVPNYIEFKGWDMDLTDKKNEDELPLELKEYIGFIESYIKVPIKVISLGPDRTQTIFRG